MVDCFYDFLEQQGSPDPGGAKATGRHSAGRGQRSKCRKDILRLYKSRHDMQNLFELMTDFDEGFQEWRYRHIKLVERTIGSKQGTGRLAGRGVFEEVAFSSAVRGSVGDQAQDVIGEESR